MVEPPVYSPGATWLGGLSSRGVDTLLHGPQILAQELKICIDYRPLAG